MHPHATDPWNTGTLRKRFPGGGPLGPVSSVVGIVLGAFLGSRKAGCRGPMRATEQWINVFFEPKMAQFDS